MAIVRCRGSLRLKRVIVTGANGYIGQHVLSSLVDLGYDVHALSRREPKDRSPVQWHSVDLFDTTATTALITDIKATHLVHLAWVTEPGAYPESPENSAWLQASVHLIEQFQRSGGKRAVIAGTCAEYDWSHGHCIEDVTPLLGRSLYARTKLDLRDRAYRLAEETGLELAWARVFFLFGGAERRERLVPTIINQLLSGNRAKCSDGDLIRDFLYVDDVARAISAVLDNDFVGDINIASGQPISFRDFVTRFAMKLDAASRIDFGHFRRGPDEPDEITAATSKLNDTVGWSPTIDFDTAVDRTIARWRNGRS